jgi:hypothetical protein
LRLSLRLLAIAVGALAAIPSFASTVVLGIDGTASLGPNFISFGATPTGGPFVPAPGAGEFMITSPTTGIFGANGVTVGELGQIPSLDTVDEPVNTLLSPPVEFVTFIGGGSNLELFLTDLLARNSQPIILTQIPNGVGGSDVIAAFAFYGAILNTADGVVTPDTSVFSATFNNTTILQLETGLPQVIPFSATLSITTTPDALPALGNRRSPRRRPGGISSPPAKCLSHSSPVVL